MIKLRDLLTTQALLNFLFGSLAILGQVGQNVSLPLWLDSSQVQISNCSDGNNGTCVRSLDVYFVFTFACLSYIFIFGAMLAIAKIITPSKIHLNFSMHSQLEMFLVGFFDALNGVMVVFAASPERTAPYLQAILGNFLIPLTVGFRFLVLRKKPSIVKAICSAVVFLSLFICLIPNFVPVFGASTQGGASGIFGALWAIIFMVGFTPAAVMNVIEERILQKNIGKVEEINLIFFLFCSSCYQFLTAAAFFWADIIPWYGSADNITILGDNWWFGCKCFFGAAGCTASSGIRGSLFIIFYVISYLGGGLLLRYSEGALFLAVVSALVTPLGFVFWTLFSESPFMWNPSSSPRTWFALGAVILMLPAILLYNYQSKVKNDEEQQLVPFENGNSISGSVNYGYDKH